MLNVVDIDIYGPENGKRKYKIGGVLTLFQTGKILKAIQYY